MKTSLFDFHLPDSLIAAQPAHPRDAARMLAIAEALQDKSIRDLPSFLKPGDVMVFNDTKVIPARLYGRRNAASIEILLHKSLPNGAWQCFAKPGKKLKPGDRIEFAADLYATVKDKLPDGQTVLAFFYTPSPSQGEGGEGVTSGNAVNVTPTLTLPLKGGGDFYRQLERHGHMPLPPYIEKQRRAEESDKEHYQTVYADREGSVAAPTAGLHFTEKLLKEIDAAGVKRVHITLHVGGGTFLPVKAEDTKDHVMHSEWAEITEASAQAINAAKRVIAVGTTSLRTLESAADEKGRVRPFSGETDIFITPGYTFKTADLLLTNFHLPRSTLFMLVCAFAGTERMKTAYAHAIAEQYRFYSYGDACLLFKNPSPF